MTPLDPQIALILLAAGRSERFGSDKLVHPYRSRPLWEWAAQAAEDAGFQTLYLVTGTHSSVSACGRWKAVINPDARNGMGTSIAAGVAAALSHRRVVIALADMPLMDPSHLRLLANRRGSVFTRQRDGSMGCPAAFDENVFAQLRSLKGDRGARSVLDTNASIVEPADDRILFDLDTMEDVRNLEGNR